MSVDSGKIIYEEIYENGFFECLLFSCCLILVNVVYFGCVVVVISFVIFYL